MTDFIVGPIVLAVTLLLNTLLSTEKIPKCHGGEVMSGGISEVGCNYEKACRAPGEKDRTDEWFRKCVETARAG